MSRPDATSRTSPDARADARLGARSDARAGDCEGTPRVDLVVMLAGGLKPSPLAAAAGRSVLDLSADGQRSILRHWVDHLSAAFAGLEGDPVPVRILHGSSLAPTPLDDGAVPRCLKLSIEREGKEFRGPAGVVKDAAEDLPPDARVLVIEAARWFGGDLSAVLRAHHASDHGPDGPVSVTVAADRRSAPAGIVVLERSTLDPISQLGFMDLKEQWLGRLAEMGRTVRVLALRSAPCILLRDREGLLAAAKLAAGPALDRPGTVRPLFTESEPGSFAAVSPDSEIGSNTSIVDSVIMHGAVVGSSAIVARSVICPGAIVDPNEVVVDQVRSAAGGPGARSHASAGSAGGHRRGRGLGRGEHSG